MIEGGGKIIQETRLFNPDTGETKSMRVKEDANDYRYFPDPDLLPVVCSQDFISAIRGALPEFRRPNAHAASQDFGLSA